MYCTATAVVVYTRETEITASSQVFGILSYTRNMALVLEQTADSNTVGTTGCLTMWTIL